MYDFVYKTQDFFHRKKKSEGLSGTPECYSLWIFDELGIMAKASSRVLHHDPGVFLNIRIMIN